MRTLYHNRSNYYGIQEKVDNLPHYGPIQSLGAGLLGNFLGWKPQTGAQTQITNKTFAQEPKPQTYSTPNLQKVSGNYKPQTQILGVNTNNQSSYNMPSNPAPQNNQQPYDQINQQQNDANAQIDADFNSAMDMLSGAEQGLRSQAGTAEGQIVNEAAKVQTSLGAEQSTREGGVNASLSTAEKQSTSAMQQARDLFRETQQQNTAQLSALGISSSSVSEALAERLGVETARRIAGVTGSIQEVRQNAVNELGRIKTYYAEKATQLAEDVKLQKQQIQNSLIQGLNQINSARSQAASNKAQARANLLSQVQSQIYDLTKQEQQFQQSLQEWAAKKSAALTPIAQDPNYLNTLISTAQTFNQQFAPKGFQFVPNVNVNAEGQMTGQIQTQATKNPDEDPLAELYRQAGI